MKFSPVKLLDLLYPRRCALCDGLLLPDEPYICRQCAPFVRFRKDTVCTQCGRPLDAEGEICLQCASSGHSFSEGVAPFAYEGIIKDSIMRFKYHERPEYAGFYAAALLSYGGGRIRRWAPDAIVPVPVHKKRLEERGYNQSLLIAKALSSRTGIPVFDGSVIRIKRTEAQKELGRSERLKNLKDAFSYIGDVKPPERILIVDDIFTTGSTVDSLGALYQANGTAEVFAACVSS